MTRDNHVSRRSVLQAGGLGILAAGAGLLAVQPAHGQDRGRQRHPRLARAIDDLRDAREYLRTAPHNFGGHRAKAIEAIDVAIEQLRQAMRF
jgi:hypothetical protein